MKARLAALAALALAVPACGGDTQGSTQLFLETFDNGFPGGNWTAATGLASAAIDTGTGSSAPSLKMSTLTASRSVSTDSLSSFDSANVTISVRAAILASPPPPPPLNGTATISIVDATPSVIATAVWDNAAGTITFTIAGAAGPVVVTAPAGDGIFHRFVFNVTSGVGNWSLDNGALLLSQSVSPSQLKVRLAGDFGTGTQWPDIFYDSITVSSP